MSLKTFFRPHEVAELRDARLAARAASHLPEDLAPGWHQDLVDPRRVLRAFEDLWVHPDIPLRAFHFVSKDGVATSAWAFPQETTTWSPQGWPPYSAEFKPAGSIHVMETVGAEPGGWPFFAASIFAREWAEMGATGAHARWRKHEILDAAPDPLPSPSFWLRDTPEEFRPHTIEDNNGTRTRFYTFRPDPLRVYLHEDWYGGDDFDAIRKVRLIGREKI